MIAGLILVGRSEIENELISSMCNQMLTRILNVCRRIFFVEKRTFPLGPLDGFKLCSSVVVQV
jgi:hypothetical protein